jgi:hypothetical protein
MKKLIAFCRKTGRRLASLANRLFRTLVRDGKLGIQVSITLPLIFSVKIDYKIDGREK